MNTLGYQYYTMRLSRKNLKKAIHLYKDLDWKITAIANRFNMTTSRLRKIFKERGIEVKSQRNVEDEDYFEIHPLLPK
jgi:MinD superfamily P-loop ATPase